MNRLLEAVMMSDETIGGPRSRAEERAFSLYLSDLRRRVLAIAAAVFLAMIVASWPLDHVFFDPEVAATYTRMRLVISAALLVGLAMLRFGPRSPRATETLSGIFIVAFCALCASYLAPLGLLGIQYLTAMPLLVVLMVLPGRARLLAVAGIVAATWGTVLVENQGDLPPDTAGTFNSTIALGLLAQVFGAWLVHLLRARHVNEQRLQRLTTGLEGRVDEQARHLRALARELMAARDTERRWLSQELHDALGQELTAMRHAGELATLQLQQGLVADAQEAIEDVGTLVTRTHGTLRRILAHMRPEAVEQLGLVEALQALVDDVARRGIAATLRLEGQPADTLPTEVGDALYRILQEALTNVARHSGARRVGVLLERSAAGVVLQVEDDGVGLQGEPEMGVCHVGLIGIQERARVCGGAATWISPPTGGLTMRVEVPHAA